MEAHSQSYWQSQAAQDEEQAREVRLTEFKLIVQGMSAWQRRLLLISLYYLLALGNLRRFLRI